MVSIFNNNNNFPSFKSFQIFSSSRIIFKLLYKILRCCNRISLLDIYFRSLSYSGKKLKFWSECYFWKYWIYIISYGLWIYAELDVFTCFCWSLRFSFFFINIFTWNWRKTYGRNYWRIALNRLNYFGIFFWISENNFYILIL